MPANQYINPKKIAEITADMKNIDTEGQIVEKDEPRKVQSRTSSEEFTVCNATLADDTGSIALTLWNDDIAKIQVADFVTIKNGYTTLFKNNIQLNVGKYGRIEVKGAPPA